MLYRSANAVLEPGHRVGDLLEAGVGQAPVPLFLAVEVHQEQDVVLGRDVMVQLAHRHVAGRGDVADGGAVEPFFEQDGAGPLHYLPLLHLGELAVGRAAGHIVLGYPQLHLFEVSLCGVHAFLDLFLWYRCHRSSPCCG